MKRPLTRRHRGFTLIEVLLVLVILVILASLATVNILSAQKSAHEKSAKIQVELFDHALQHFQLDIGSYPSTGSGLQALQNPPSDLPDPTKWAGPYLDKGIPLDPWNRQYEYCYPGQRNLAGFDVWTTTPDGKVIGNWTEEARR
jgi:general secretion pathway protein G